MKEFSGDPKFPIWLIADSPPENWVDKLEFPLDPKHPARHNIWTPILDSLQDRLFRQQRRRFDTSRLYVRNALDIPLATSTPEQQQQGREKLQELINKYKPKLILTFGVYAFLSTSLAAGQPFRIPPNTAKLLGQQFRSSITNYSDRQTNVIPLLHVSIARGRFLEAHRDFIGTGNKEHDNYFNYVGERLADLLLGSFSDEQIWIL
jgi:hypothetical protein